MLSLVHSYLLMNEWVAPLSTRASTITLAPAPLSEQQTTGNYSNYRHVVLEIDDNRPVLTKACFSVSAGMGHCDGAIDLLLFCNS